MNAIPPDLDALATSVEAASRLLNSYGEKHWGRWLAKDAALIRNLDFRGIEHFIGAFGGMGSINDLIICPANGHLISENRVDAVNNELNSLLSEAADLAQKLYAEEQARVRGA